MIGIQSLIFSQQRNEVVFHKMHRVRLLWTASYCLSYCSFTLENNATSIHFVLLSGIHIVHYWVLFPHECGWLVKLQCLFLAYVSELIDGQYICIEYWNNFDQRNNNVTNWSILTIASFYKSNKHQFSSPAFIPWNYFMCQGLNGGKKKSLLSLLYGTLRGVRIEIEGNCCLVWTISEWMALIWFCLWIWLLGMGY